MKHEKLWRLNSSIFPRLRFFLLRVRPGFYTVAAGSISNGRFASYRSVQEFMLTEHVPENAKDSCRKFLRQEGYTI
jgi:hypothetical protein